MRHFALFCERTRVIYATIMIRIHSIHHVLEEGLGILESCTDFRVKLPSRKTWYKRWFMLLSPCLRPLRFNRPSFRVSKDFHNLATRASWAFWSSPSMIPGGQITAVDSWPLWREGDRWYPHKDHNIALEETYDASM